MDLDCVRGYYSHQCVCVCLSVCVSVCLSVHKIGLTHERTDGCRPNVVDVVNE